MIIETERLLLRELCHEDFDALYTVLSHSDISRHYPYTFDEQRVYRWIQCNIDRYHDFGFGLWAIVLKHSGELIGDCGLSMQSINGVIRPEIGYHIRRDLWLRGYAGEAARACRDWAFSNTPFNTLYSYMKKVNLASAATARSCGMQWLFDFCDTEDEQSSVYAITREAWNRVR